MSSAKAVLLDGRLCMLNGVNAILFDHSLGHNGDLSDGQAAGWKTTFGWGLHGPFDNCAYLRKALNSGKNRALFGLKDQQRERSLVEHCQYGSRWKKELQCA